VSLDEAAAIFLLTATVIPDRHVAVPRLTPIADLHELEPIAEGFLRTAGFSAAWYDEEQAARDALEGESERGTWPILRTPRDTDGEKAEEAFLGAGEKAIDVGLRQLCAVPQRGTDVTTLRDVIATLADWIDDASKPVDKNAIAQCLARVVPEFAPFASGKSLDDRM
jgi:hypothetical protein